MAKTARGGEALETELARVRAQQAASRQILEAIGRAHGDVAPVLQTIVEAATDLCHGDHAGFFSWDGEGLVLEVTTGDWHGAVVDTRVDPRRMGLAGVAATSGITQHMLDVLSPDWSTRFPGLDKDEAGWSRSRLAVPVFRQGAVAGVIRVGKKEPGGFTTQEIELVESFAAQAAIAIDNARLFNETKEALGQQTATNEVLRAISEARDDVGPVAITILESAMRLCAAESAVFFQRQDDDIVVVAKVGATKPIERQALVDHHGIVGVAFARGKTFHAKDMRAEELRLLISPETSPSDWAPPNNLTRLAVPVLRNGVAIGVIRLHREQPGGFSDRQVALIEAFADQAAIAIENVRLFNETKASLERQTAIAEILGAISASPTDIAPVLDVIAHSAARYCGAEDVVIMLRRGAVLYPEAHYGVHAHTPREVSIEGSLSGEAIREARTVHIHDMAATSGYPSSKGGAGGTTWVRTALAQPLFRGGEAIGTILVRRTEVRPFSDAEIDLVRTFADQASIAIENVRLFNETKEALERQTAISETLSTLAASPTNLEHVLDAIAENAVRFCAAEDGVLALVEDAMFRLAAEHHPTTGIASQPELRLPIDRTTPIGRAIVDRRLARVDDWLS
ncbi:MAG TPA: GAF domain-containing protein, partial [Methylomirabilota bacterium]|nr:GAF domain-containing protein [Methylomirabilota bacterium]